MKGAGLHKKIIEYWSTCRYQKKEAWWSKRFKETGQRRCSRTGFNRIITIIYNAITLTMKKFKSMEILHNIMVQILSTENWRKITYTIAWKTSSEIQKYYLDELLCYCFWLIYRSYIFIIWINNRGILIYWFLLFTSSNICLWKYSFEWEYLTSVRLEAIIVSLYYCRKLRNG